MGKGLAHRTEQPVPQNGTSAGSVQSLERAFELLELIADSGGAQGLSQLSSSSGLPLTTIHRLMGTLLRMGYVRRGGSRQYVLGPRLIRLGETASLMLGSWVKPHLAELVELTGETSNMAVLEGDVVVYLAQMPGRHSMRMFTEPGRRVDPHCTAVGKAMLAQLPEADVRIILDRTGMAARTANTITDPDLLIAHLGVIRRQGYAIDEGEQEVGVRCVAVAVPDSPTTAAISVSGPQARMTETAVRAIVPALQRVAADLSKDFNSEESSG
jgi:IclR family transcriptional regulator, acetate operon repressor